MYFEFCNRTKLLCGELALEHIPGELRGLGIQRPFLLTKDSLRKRGLAQLLEKPLREAGMAFACIFGHVPPDSAVAVVEQAAAAFREAGCDGIVALGGGSVLDTAKGMEIVLSQGGRLKEHMGADILSRGSRVPLIAIPTTAGTGSEATCVAVIRDEARGVKMEFISEHLLPDVAVIDPRMTLSLPPRMTAATGMDALVHAVEAYTCLQRNPLSSAHAAAALRLIGENIERAVENGRDAQARLHMALAAAISGAAFSSSMVGLVHALGHACGGVAGAPHGEAMNILLPWCMEYNMPALAPLYGELLLPLAGEAAYMAAPPQQRPAAAVAFARNLSKKFRDACGLPATLQEAGVRREQLPAIARAATRDGAMLYNPVDAGEGECMEILQKAFGE